MDLADCVLVEASKLKVDEARSDFSKLEEKLETMSRFLKEVKRRHLVKIKSSWFRKKQKLVEHLHLAVKSYTTGLIGSFDQRKEFGALQQCFSRQEVQH